MKNKTLFPLALCLVAGLLLIACGGGASDNAANSSNAAANGNKAANTSTANTSTTSTSGDKIGVPECDDYISKYEACVNSKVPEAMRASVKATLETSRKMWKDAATTPQGKAGLAAACKQALETAKSSMGSYGCSW
jgi:hypothetical protein